jgi:hypothetical protein
MLRPTTFKCIAKRHSGTKCKMNGRKEQQHCDCRPPMVRVLCGFQLQHASADQPMHCSKYTCRTYGWHVCSRASRSTQDHQHRGMACSSPGIHNTCTQPFNKQPTTRSPLATHLTADSSRNPHGQARKRSAATAQPQHTAADGYQAMLSNVHCSLLTKPPLAGKLRDTQKQQPVEGRLGQLKTKMHIL